MTITDLVAEARQYGEVKLVDGRLHIDGVFPARIRHELEQNIGGIRKFLANEAVIPADVHESLELLRQALPPNLAGLPDGSLLLLVQFTIGVARNRTQGKASRYCPTCGIPMSGVAVADQCGFCGSPYRTGNGTQST